MFAAVVGSRYPMSFTRRPFVSRLGSILAAGRSGTPPPTTRVPARPSCCRRESRRRRPSAVTRVVRDDEALEQLLAVARDVHLAAEPDEVVDVADRLDLDGCRRQRDRDARSCPSSRTRPDRRLDGDRVGVEGRSASWRATSPVDPHDPSHASAAATRPRCRHGRRGPATAAATSATAAASTAAMSDASDAGRSSSPKAPRDLVHEHRRSAGAPPGPSPSPARATSSSASGSASRRSLARRRRLEVRVDDGHVGDARERNRPRERLEQHAAEP